MSQMLSDFPMSDIDALFGALAERLRRIADDSRETNDTWAVDSNDRFSAGVLDCVTALDQLRAMLAGELERRHKLEQIVSDAQAALERAPPELVAVLGLTLRAPPISRLLSRAPGPSRAG